MTSSELEAPWALERLAVHRMAQIVLASRCFQISSRYHWREPTLADSCNASSPPHLAKTLGTERHRALIALLIEKRESSGLTQTELADKLGEYQSFVARLESGQRRVDVIEFLELARILNFDPHDALRRLTKE